MKIPAYLKPGSTIRIVSPAGKVKEGIVLPALEWLVQQGFRVKTGKNVFSQHFQFAGTDEQRLADLQEAFDDPETDAIICSRGGYGTVRIIEKLDFAGFHKKPKWLVGFSDITILHCCLNNLGYAAIHGTMPRYFFNDDGTPNENLDSLMKILTGESMEYVFSNSAYNKPGNATAELVGGNLSIISSLQGTKYEIGTRGKILFIEDIDEFLYHTDRMIRQLKMAGKLDGLAGLVIGDFTDMKDNESPFGKTVHQIIEEAVQDFNYPVCYGFPAGHDKKNLALAFGKPCELDVTRQNATLKLK